MALSTATSSGKSVVFNVSVMEAILGPRPAAVALYLFPTKALAQDQLRCSLQLTKTGDTATVKLEWVTVRPAFPFFSSCA